MASETCAPRVDIMLRPMGSPLPLGFLAFAMGTVLLSAVEIGWVPPEQSWLVGIIALAFVVPLELIPVFVAFASRDTASAATFGVFSCSWGTVALSFLVMPPGATSPALAVFLFMDALIVLLLAVAAYKAKPLFTTILGLASVRFVLSAVHELGAGGAVQDTAAGVGLALGAVALYGALALLFEDARQKAVLPLFRKGSAEQALEGSLQEQLERLQNEAGVRQQL